MKLIHGKRVVHINWNINAEKQVILLITGDEGM